VSPPHRVAIVQARTGSERLPGKVLRELAGRPMLAWQLERLGRCRRLDAVVVATTERPADDAVAGIAAAAGVGCFRGDEHDVLGRYAAAAREAGAELVIRATGDCPLLDPEVVDRVIAALEEGLPDCDYASNVVERSWPRGLDCEAFTRATLERCERLATSPAAREHVTHFILRERPDLFRVRSVRAPGDWSALRWTVDTPEDFAFVQRVFEAPDLDAGRAGFGEILAWLRRHTEVEALNRDVLQREPGA